MNALISSALWNEKFFCVFRTFWIAEDKCRVFEDCMQGGWVVFSLFYAEKHISRGRRSDVMGKSGVYKERARA